MTDESHIDQQIDGQRSKGGTGGASIRMEDSRFTHLIGWSALAVGGLFVTFLIWIGSTLVGIKESMASMAATMGEQAKALAARVDRNDQLDERQEQHINYVDGRVYTLEGRNLRGGAERGAEAKRGH